jgi:hypothetical protein
MLVVKTALILVLVAFSCIEARRIRYHKRETIERDGKEIQRDYVINLDSKKGVLREVISSTSSDGLVSSSEPVESAEFNFEHTHSHDFEGDEDKKKDITEEDPKTKRPKTHKNLTVATNATTEASTTSTASTTTPIVTVSTTVAITSASSSKKSKMPKTTTEEIPASSSTPIVTEAEETTSAVTTESSTTKRKNKTIRPTTKAVNNGTSSTVEAKSTVPATTTLENVPNTNQTANKGVKQSISGAAHNEHNTMICLLSSAFLLSIFKLF